MNKISAVYKIINTVTKDSYIGSSKNVYVRWMQHKRPSVWKRYTNITMYQDMKKYGVDKFRFQILAPVMSGFLRQVEQEFIDMLHPTYNKCRANGLDIERKRKRQQSEKYRDVRKKYRQSEMGREVNRKQARKDMKKYHNQLCYYNGETLTLNTLSARFRKVGIEHPTLEAKKYLLNQQ